MTIEVAIALCGFALLAGAMDTIVGAGGLIQIPALLVLVPEAEVAAVLGTHKLASTVGTAAAVHQYHRAGQLKRHTMIPAMLVPALAGAFLGASTVPLIPSHYLRPALLVFLIAAVLFVFLRKDIGASVVPRHGRRHGPLFGASLGLALGFYDGAIGLGAGSLFLLALITIWGLDFVSAAAAARVINLATNLSATAAFAYSGDILYTIAIPLALLNVLGAVVGARLVAAKGSRFVRTVFLLGIVGLIIRVIYDLFGSGR